VNAASGFPARYAEEWKGPFNERVEQALRPGIRILDVGSGRKPTVEPAARPPGCVYIGLDLSSAELDAAPPGSYDETFVGDIVDFRSELADRFDLIVSWQVFEHVRPMRHALENVRRYLRPRGLFVAHLSGRYSAFGLANQLIPHSVAVWAMKRLLKRDPASVFPAYYDRCSYTGLRNSLTRWSQVEVLPRYKGGGYFSFSTPLQRAYLVYENWAHRRERRNLATHYLICARR
jgi:SAM-dependent methyltransferase